MPASWADDTNDRKSTIEDVSTQSPNMATQPLEIPMKKFALIVLAVTCSLAFAPQSAEACCILRGIGRGLRHLFGH